MKFEHWTLICWSHNVFNVQYDIPKNNPLGKALIEKKRILSGIAKEWCQGIWNINFFCQSLKITSDILRYIRYPALQCHLAAAFYFKINVASFIFSDLSSDAWTFSCLYSKRYIIYGQNSQSQEFQQNNLLKSCIGSLVKSEDCNRTASPPNLAHCVPPLSAKGFLEKWLSVKGVGGGGRYPLNGQNPLSSFWKVP